LLSYIVAIGCYESHYVRSLSDICNHQQHDGANVDPDSYYYVLDDRWSLQHHSDRHFGQRVTDDQPLR
jgi:hypothetical protein